MYIGLGLIQGDGGDTMGSVSVVLENDLNTLPKDLKRVVVSVLLDNFSSSPSIFN